MQLWIIHKQKWFHYSLLALSALIVASCIRFALETPRRYLLLIVLPVLLLVATCLVYMRSWQQYCKYEHYCKRIRQEYKRVVGTQPYKMRRLTTQESEVLLYLLEGYRQEEISFLMHINYTILYRCIGNIKRKLEIPTREALLDIDWKKTIA